METNEQTHAPADPFELLRAELDWHRTLLEGIAARLHLDPVLMRVTPASDDELDSEYGNPTIDRAPKDWAGEPVEGRRMDELQPVTLRALARKYLALADWHDGKGNVDNKGRPRSYWSRKDASRAYGWALRLERQGHRGPSRPQAQQDDAPEL